MLQVLDQRDFGLFLWLLFCGLCVLECVVLNREEGPGRRWLAFFSYFLFQALAVSWTLAAPLLETGWRFIALPTFLRSLAYGSLLAFASAPDAGRGRKRIMLAISIGLIAAGAVLGLAGSGAAYSLLVHALLGIPGLVFAVRFIRADQAARTPPRPWLNAYAVTFGISLACLVTESVAGEFSPALIRQWFLPLHILLSLALTIILTVHEWRSFNRANRGLGGKLTRASIYGAFCVIPVLIVLGGVLTSLLGTRTFLRIREEYANNVELIRATLLLETDAMDDSVSILARTPSIRGFLVKPGCIPPRRDRRGARYVRGGDSREHVLSPGHKRPGACLIEQEIAGLIRGAHSAGDT